jgi:micrococcal nuclease
MKSLAALILAFFLLIAHAFAQDIVRQNENPKNTVNYKNILVSRVIDGDTVELENGERVRLIGIDTPELYDERKPVMYFAQEASKFTKQMAEGKMVRLEFDENNEYLGHKDKYGRTLAYIYLEDGTFLNAEIIKQGYGFAYTKFLFKYMEEFRKYQQEAMENEKGLWGETIHNPEVSSLIMQYENLNEEGKKLLKEYMTSLSIKHSKESSTAQSDIDNIQGIEIYLWNNPQLYDGSLYGKEVTVEFTVVNSNNSGKACFLNAHSDWKKYFTAVIFRADFYNFPSNPEKYYYMKKLRITGRLKKYENKPEIILKNPSQIEIK